jgi:hypothetical protein
VTGIGATACCHGFFVLTSVVDFQKGERYVPYIDIKNSGDDISLSPGRSIWTTVYAKLCPTTWMTFQSLW